MGMSIPHSTHLALVMLLSVCQDLAFPFFQESLRALVFAPNARA